MVAPKQGKVRRTWYPLTLISGVLAVVLGMLVFLRPANQRDGPAPSSGLSNAASSPTDSDLAGIPLHTAKSDESVAATPDGDVKVDDIIRPLQDEEVRRSAQRLEGLASVPARKWRTDLVERMRAETIVETVDRLSDIDGMHFAHMATGVQGAI